MKWSVTVERLRKHSYRTVFTVGVQSFILRQIEDDEEAKQVCTFIAKMFKIALANLGLKKRKKKR